MKVTASFAGSRRCAIVTAHVWNAGRWGSRLVKLLLSRRFSHIARSMFAVAVGEEETDEESAKGGKENETS